MARTAADHSQPSYSPDGKTLAYISSVETSRYVTLVLHSLDNGSEQEIPTALIEANDPQWFPDGRSVLILGLNHAGARLSLHRIDVRTGKNLLERVVQADDMVRVSPNGRTLYFVRRIAKAEVALLAHDVESGRETPLFTASAGIGTDDLAVSPDGQRLAFVNFQTREVTVVPASGGAPTALRRFDGDPPSVVRWSKDGRELVVWHSREIWMVPIDGGSARRVGTETLQRMRAIQTTGTQVAFAAEVPGTVVPPEVWVDRNLVPAAGPSSSR